MKNLTTSISILFLLIFTSCDINDDGFYNNRSIKAQNSLVTFPATTSYNVGTFFYVTADFSRYQAEVGQTALLDLFTTTGNASQYAFTYVLERRVNANEWETITVPDNQLQVLKGFAQSTVYMYALCNFNSTDETYEYNVGIPLTATGNYRLSFGYNSSLSDSVELRSINPRKNITLNVNTTLQNLDSSGFFYFNVN